MSDKVEWPGGWAKIRDPLDVTERNRFALEEVRARLFSSSIGSAIIENEQRDMDQTEQAKLLQPYLVEALTLAKDSDYLLIKALVEEWSYAKPITVEEIKDLPGRAFDALKTACEPLLPKILGDAAEEEGEIDDPASNFPAASD